MVERSQVSTALLSHIRLHQYHTMVRKIFNIRTMLRSLQIELLCTCICMLVGSVRVYDLPNKQLLCHSQYTLGGSSLIWAPVTVDPSATTIFAGFTDGVVRSAEISTYMYIVLYVCTKGLALPCLCKNAGDF